MRILAFETSCDDTSVCLIEGDPLAKPLSFTIHAHFSVSHANASSIVEAHSAAIAPLTIKALRTIALPHGAGSNPHSDIGTLCDNNQALIDSLTDILSQYSTAPVDAIAVTQGPGSAECLSVGVNTARTLATAWGVLLIPINHMEGHVLSALFTKEKPDSNKASIKSVSYPSLGLVISKTHTELILLRSPLQYEVVGKTIDEPVGDAYYKVGQMLDVPHPSGPGLAALADEYRDAFKNRDSLLKNLFPRPMLHSGNYNFSFSGLRTTVGYHIRDMGRNAIDRTDKQRMAYAFESALSEVLAEKTRSAIQHYGVRALLLSGGVAMNRHLRRKFTHVTNDEQVALYLPEPDVAADNALMIALSALYRLSFRSIQEIAINPLAFVADENLKL